MAYQLTIPVALGTSQTGLSLEAQLVNTSGANVGSAVTTGFVELGAGMYLWTGSIPDGHTGGVKFQVAGGGALKASTAINPQETENTDVKTSTRNSVAPLDSTATASAVQTGLTAQAYTSARAVKLDNLDASVASRSSHSAADVWAVTTRTLTGFGTLVADIVAGVWGAAARTLTAIGFPVTAGTVLDKSGYSLSSNPPTAQAITDAVLNELLSGHTTAGSVGAGIAAAGTAGDPWSAMLPGSYVSGQAGYTIGHNLDAPVSTRAGAGASVTTIGAVLDGGTVQLVAGDTYQGERGTALRWHYTGPADLLTVPAPVVTLEVGASLSVPVAVSGTTGNYDLSADISSSQTRALRNRGSDFSYAVRAKWSDPDKDRVTLVHGSLQVSV